MSRTILLLPDRSESIFCYVFLSTWNVWLILIMLWTVYFLPDIEFSTLVFVSWSFWPISYYYFISLRCYSSSLWYKVGFCFISYYIYSCCWNYMNCKQALMIRHHEWDFFWVYCSLVHHGWICRMWNGVSHVMFIDKHHDWNEILSLLLCFSLTVL